MTFGDVNGDGELEVVFGTTSGYLYAVSGRTGLDIPNFPFKTHGRIAASVLITQLSQGLSQQLVVMSFDGHLYMVDGISGASCCCAVLCCAVLCCAMSPVICCTTTTCISSVSAGLRHFQNHSAVFSKFTRGSTPPPKCKAMQFLLPSSELKPVAIVQGVQTPWTLVSSPTAWCWQMTWTTMVTWTCWCLP